MAVFLVAEDLMRGEIYALEQAGHLLHDAISLYEQRRYSSAVVLGVYCREELGRARIFRELRKQSRTSEPVSVKEVRIRCASHLEKLRRGQTGTVIRYGPDQRQRFMPLFDPAHPQFEDARKMVDDAARKRRQRDSQETHERRMRSLYVEPCDEGTGWNRPCQVSREEAQPLLEDVANDYSLRLDQIQGRDKELASALQEWTDLPPLPKPVWPRM